MPEISTCIRRPQAIGPLRAREAVRGPGRHRCRPPGDVRPRLPHRCCQPSSRLVPGQGPRPQSQAALNSLPGPSPRTSRCLAEHGGETGAASAVPPANVPPELANHPKFRIVRELGRGGMGVIYLAEHRVLEEARRAEGHKPRRAGQPRRPGPLPRRGQGRRQARSARTSPRLRRRPGRRPAHARHGVRRRRDPGPTPGAKGNASDRCWGLSSYKPRRRWACSMPSSTGWLTATSNRKTSW